jgi:hypothetical protein
VYRVVVGPLHGHEPLHTQHHEGYNQKDGDSHRALRESVTFLRTLPVRQVLPRSPREGLGAVRRKATCYLCFTDSVCRTGYALRLSLDAIINLCNSCCKKTCERFRAVA